jgi:hypothetical protein
MPTTIHDSPLDPRLVLKRTSPSTLMAMYATPAVLASPRQFFFTVDSVRDGGGRAIPAETLERVLSQMWAGGCALTADGIRVRVQRFMPYEVLHVVGRVVDEEFPMEA